MAILHGNTSLFNIKNFKLKRSYGFGINEMITLKNRKYSVPSFEEKGTECLTISTALG